MPVTEPTSFEDRRRAHASFAGEYGTLADRAGVLENRISAVRLVSFLVAAAAGYSAFTGGGWPAIGTSLLAAATFIEVPATPPSW